MTLKVEIDPDALSAAVAEQMLTAVQSAVSGFDVKEAISARVCASISHDAIGASVDRALAQLDQSELVQAIADQMARTIASAVCIVVEDAVITMLLRLRGIPDYEREKVERASAEIRAQLRARKEARS